MSEILFDYDEYKSTIIIFTSFFSTSENIKYHFTDKVIAKIVLSNHYKTYFNIYISGYGRELFPELHNKHYDLTGKQPPFTVNTLLPDLGSSGNLISWEFKFSGNKYESISLGNSTNKIILDDSIVNECFNVTYNL